MYYRYLPLEKLLRLKLDTIGGCHRIRIQLKLTFTLEAFDVKELVLDANGLPLATLAARSTVNLTLSI